MKGVHGRASIINKLQCLSANDAVKRIARDIVSLCQISDDCGPRVRVIQVKNVVLRDTAVPKLCRVDIVAYFKHTPPNIAGPGREKPLDVIPVDAEGPVPAIQPEQATDRLHPT